MRFEVKGDSIEKIKQIVDIFFNQKGPINICEILENIKLEYFVEVESENRGRINIFNRDGILEKKKEERVIFVIWLKISKEMLERVWDPENARKLTYNKDTQHIALDSVHDACTFCDYPELERNPELTKELVAVAKIRSVSDNKKIFDDTFEVCYRFELY